MLTNLSIENPRSKLVIIHGMGHDISLLFTDQIAEEIAETASKAN